jgi:hypothetical protein
MTQDNVTPLDPIAALLAKADAELAEEFNKNDVAAIKTMKRRIADARQAVQNLEFELEAKIRDLRARRSIASV